MPQTPNRSRRTGSTAVWRYGSIYAKGKVIVKKLAAGLFLFAVVQGAWAQRNYPDGLYAEITTPKGLIVISLAFEQTPMTVANFVGLAEGTIENAAFPLGVPFFDGSRFQRVAPGHVIQGGGANSEQASSSGTPIPNEIHPELSHDHAGAVGMANGGPHTATNQFYITLGDRSYLDGDYAVFGEVVEGMDVVRNIVPNDGIESVRVVRVGRAAEEFRPTTESFRESMAVVRENVRVAGERKQEEERRYVQRNWPSALPATTGWSYVVTREGSGDLPAHGDRLTVHYNARTVDGKVFGSAGDEGQPGWLEPDAEMGATFVFRVGTTTVTPGFDEAVAQMRRGERRVVIVPARMAYGRRGYYAPSNPGRPRFHVSPNTMLVYEIEVWERR